MISTKYIYPVLLITCFNYVSSTPFKHLFQSIQKRAPASTKQPFDLYELARANAKCPIDISTFKVEDFLGEGLFGSVYLVTNPRNSSEKYALKSNLAENAHDKQMIQTEIENQMSIKSPYVVRLYCSYKTSSRAFMLMEYVSGGDLENFNIKRKDVKRMTAQILIGLKDIHANNVVHGDLHEGNVLLDSNRNIKIADFGYSFKTIDNYSKKRDIRAVHGLFLLFRPYVYSNEQLKFNELLDTMKRMIPTPSIKRFMMHPFFEGVDWVHFENNDWKKLGNQKCLHKVLGFLKECTGSILRPMAKPF